MSFPKETRNKRARVSNRRNLAHTTIMALISTFLVVLPQSPALEAIATLQPVTFTSIMGGNDHTVALSAEGLLYSWGRNEKGQLGDGTTQDRLSPGPVSMVNAGGATFSSIAVSDRYSLALTNEGHLFAWGYNFYGNLGNGTVVDSLVPIAVSTQLTFSAVSAGSAFAVALTSEGRAYAWGYNANGQLGDGTTTTTAAKRTPIPVSTNLTFSAISAGHQHTLALVSSGQAYAWGHSWFGAVGDGNAGYNTNRPTPTAVSGGITFSSVAAGSLHSTALTEQGTAYTWGLNDNYQLGDGTQTNRSVPTAVQTNLKFVQLAPANLHTSAIDENGRLFGWGTNDRYGLGRPLFSPQNSSTPIEASTVSSGLLTFSAITAGASTGVLQNFALASDGSWFRWGSNQYGQLAAGSTQNLAVPTPFSDYIPGPASVFGAPVVTPASIDISLSCTGNCGSGNSFTYAISVTPAGGGSTFLTDTATTTQEPLSFTGLSANTVYTIEASVSYNGETSATVSTTVTTPKPTATISAVTVADTTATLAVGCSNCGAAPDSFTISATPVSGGTAITSTTNLISSLSSETTYSFSVVVAYAGTTSDSVEWQDNPVMTLPFLPIISTVVPAAVPLAGGSITVTGANFTTSTEVSFAGSTVSFTIVDGTTITFTAPAQAAGVYGLAITNPVGTGTRTSAVQYVTGPSITTTSPAVGTVNGGTIVTVTGTAFLLTSEVRIGSTTVSYTVLSDNVLRFVTPASSSGIVDIGVTSVGGTNTASAVYEYTSSALVPSISSITPTTGPQGGGTVITVTGEHLSGSYSDSISLAIAGVSGSSVVVIDDSTLTFVSPAGSGSNLDVTVSVGGQLGTYVGAYTYTAPAPTAGNSGSSYAYVPEILEFSIRVIYSDGGTVTISGKRLGSIATMKLAGKEVTVSENTDTSATFTVGDLPIGVWDLYLVNAYGQLTFQQAITVIAPEVSPAAVFLGYRWTLIFTGNSRELGSGQVEGLRQVARDFEDAESIICWGYTTASDPKPWAITHAEKRAQAACDQLSQLLDVKSFVRLRYGTPKSFAMKAAIQFWDSGASE